MSEPIAAIASGGTRSVFGIIRMSGDGCFTICDQVFRANNGKPFSRQNPRELVVGLLLDSQAQPIDQVLAVRFPGPRSFTGEDSRYASATAPRWSWTRSCAPSLPPGCGRPGGVNLPNVPS